MVEVGQQKSSRSFVYSKFIDLKFVNSKLVDFRLVVSKFVDSMLINS